MDYHIRKSRPDEIEILKAITVESFGGVSVDHLLEQKLGVLGGHDWKWRKARHIDADLAANAEGTFVAESGGQVVGYITTVVDVPAGKGRIPNLAVTAAARGHGIGRALIEHALDSFRQQKLAFAMIETMETNPVGQTLYPSCGFVEVARQIHFACRL